MLPFLLKPKRNDGGVIVEHRPSDTKSEDKDHEYGMEAAAKDVMEAINSNDIKRLSKALHSAFQIYDAAPHKEFDHSEDQE